MSVNFPASTNPIIWDKNSILNKGAAFLEQKNEYISSCYDLLQSANEYNTGLEIFKASIEESVKEIKTLDKAIVKILHQEIAENPTSPQVNRLLKVYAASNAAFNYYTSIKDSSAPSVLENAQNIATTASLYCAATTAILTPTAYLVTKLTGWNFPENAKLPFQISSTLLIALTTGKVISNILWDIPAAQNTAKLGNIYTRAMKNLAVINS